MIQIIKLKRGGEKHQELAKVAATRYHSNLFMEEYLTSENLEIIKDAVHKYIDLVEAEKKGNKLKAVYTSDSKKASDDTWLNS